MARKFADLRAGMSPEAQTRSRRKTVELLAEMPLQELRKARGLSQQTLANVLQVKQPTVAKMEHRTDMYISTLRSHIEAMGGELDIIARFPDGCVKVSNFAAIEEEKKEESA